jgi:phosphoribosyl-ATP pyrophosphohydrolase/phosphoribosyl-AMP cyclohydrolase
MISFSDLTPGADGLVVAVVQDVNTRDVLMVGYMDQRAFDATQSTGQVHFWSRSRNELWRKGDTSGNTLAMSDIRADCDSDALLVLARPNGPTCHTGLATCFGERAQTFGMVLDRLVGIVDARKGADPSESYTATLIGDPDLAARKVLEEAGEVAFAAKDAHTGSSSQRVVEEVADELYHLLALLTGLGIDPTEVATELENRMVGDGDS